MSLFICLILFNIGLLIGVILIKKLERNTVPKYSFHYKRKFKTILVFMFLLSFMIACGYISYLVREEVEDASCIALILWFGILMCSIEIMAIAENIRKTSTMFVVYYLFNLAVLISLQTHGLGF